MLLLPRAKESIDSAVSLSKRVKNNTQYSNVVPHRSTNWARQCLTSQSRRDAVLSLLYGRSWHSSYYVRIINITLIAYTFTFTSTTITSWFRPQTLRNPSQSTRNWKHFKIHIGFIQFRQVLIKLCSLKDKQDKRTKEQMPKCWAGWRWLAWPWPPYLHNATTE